MSRSHDQRNRAATLKRAISERSADASWLSRFEYSEDGITEEMVVYPDYTTEDEADSGFPVTIELLRVRGEHVGHMKIDANAIDFYRFCRRAAAAMEAEGIIERVQRLEHRHDLEAYRDAQDEDEDDDEEEEAEDEEDEDEDSGYQVEDGDDFDNDAESDDDENDDENDDDD